MRNDPWAGAANRSLILIKCEEAFDQFVRRARGLDRCQMEQRRQRLKIRMRMPNALTRRGGAGAIQQQGSWKGKGMRCLRVLLMPALLLASCASGFAQMCTPPAQACAAGPNGWGGCYLPGPAQCLSGMICQRGASVCPPGKNGEGACYDRRIARCDDGALASNADPSPAGSDGKPDGIRPEQSPAANDGQPVTGCRPASGEDRVGVLNALRTPVSADLRTEVEFAVERARICGDWAFVIATPQRRGGGALRWAGTVCAGDTSHRAGGLVRRSGATWRLVEYALCPSDVAWADWPERFNAPQALFDE